MADGIKTQMLFKKATILLLASKQTFLSLLGTYSMDTFDKKMSIKVRYTPLADMTFIDYCKIAYRYCRNYHYRKTKKQTEKPNFIMS
jgi:hypothetical protein